MIHVSYFMHLKDGVLVNDNPSYELIVGSMLKIHSIFFPINKFKLMSTCKKRKHTCDRSSKLPNPTQQNIFIGHFHNHNMIPCQSLYSPSNILSNDSIDNSKIHKEIKKGNSNHEQPNQSKRIQLLSSKMKSASIFFFFYFKWPFREENRKIKEENKKWMWSKGKKYKIYWKMKKKCSQQSVEQWHSRR